MNLVIYIPVYNASNTIEDLINRIFKLEKEIKKVILVDDASTDDTLHKITKNERIIVLKNKKNMGPVGTLIKGMEEAIKHMDENTILIRMDSDLEHQPEDIIKLIEPIEKKETLLSVGHLPFDSRSGLLTKQFNEIIGSMESKKYLGIDLPQYCSGFQAIHNSIFPYLFEKMKKANENYDKEMLFIEFLMLYYAKDKTHIKIIKQRKIEDKYIKKMPLKKQIKYLKYHFELEKYMKNMNK